MSVTINAARMSSLSNVNAAPMRLKARLNTFFRVFVTNG